MPKAINIACYQAEEIPNLPDNTVLISINEEYGDLHNLQIDRKNPNVLTVRFSDVTGEEKIDDNVTLKPIDGDTVLNILDFIERNKGKNFIIHCAVGMSRSAAICLYLHLFHGYDLKPRFWNLSQPNPFVLGRLIILSKIKELHSNE